MLKKNNIFITGFMGTGKSTIARALSKKTKKKWIDMDYMIEEREGEPIVDIFNMQGETYFRKLEREVLSEIIRQENLIIATGGGALLDEKNYQLVKKNNIIILLKATPEVIFHRLQKEDNRPLLSGQNKLDRIANLMSQREDKYSRFKHHIDTSNLTVEQVVEKIIKICRRENNGNNIT